MVPLTVVSIVETLVVARVIPTVKALTFNDALGDFATELKLLEFLAYWLDEFPHPLVDTIVLYSVTAWGVVVTKADWLQALSMHASVDIVTVFQELIMEVKVALEEIDDSVAVSGVLWEGPATEAEEVLRTSENVTICPVSAITEGLAVFDETEETFSPEGWIAWVFATVSMRLSLGPETECKLRSSDIGHQVVYEVIMPPIVVMMVEILRISWVFDEVVDVLRTVDVVKELEFCGWKEVSGVEKLSLRVGDELDCFLALENDVEYEEIISSDLEFFVAPEGLIVFKSRVPAV